MLACVRELIDSTIHWRLLAGSLEAVQALGFFPLLPAGDPEGVSPSSSGGDPTPHEHPLVFTTKNGKPFRVRAGSHHGPPPRPQRRPAPLRLEYRCNLPLEVEQELLGICGRYLQQQADQVRDYLQGQPFRPPESHLWATGGLVLGAAVHGALRPGAFEHGDVCMWMFARVCVCPCNVARVVDLCV